MNNVTLVEQNDYGLSIVYRELRSDAVQKQFAQAIYVEGGITLHKYLNRRANIKQQVETANAQLPASERTPIVDPERFMLFSITGPVTSVGDSNTDSGLYRTQITIQIYSTNVSDSLLIGSVVMRHFSGCTFSNRYYQIYTDAQMLSPVPSVRESSFDSVPVLLNVQVQHNRSNVPSL